MPFFSARSRRPTSVCAERASAARRASGRRWYSRDSMRDRSSRSSTSFWRRSALRSMMSRKRAAAPGSPPCRGGAQRLGGGADRGDRRAELVRDVGDEVAADRLEAAQVGDVEEDGEHAAEAGEARARTRSRRGFRPESSISPPPARLDELLQLVVADDLERALAGHVGGQEQHLAERRVHDGDAAARRRGRGRPPAWRRGCRRRGRARS